MTLWDLLIVWLLSQLGGAGPRQPPWPTPPTPTPPVPTPPVPTPPVPTPPVPTPPVPTPPVTPPAASAWKPYWYAQPDAGKAYGTPYNLAQTWVNDGSRWTEMYNYSKGRPIAATKGHGDQWVDPGSGGGSLQKLSLHGETTDYPADVGDKLLIPSIWPDPPNSTIQSRCSTIPDGTPLPGVTLASTVHGDEDFRTI